MKFIVALLAGILMLIFYTVPSYAIPAFTRANKVECSTCHTIFPELNEYGEAFLKNGYVYIGKGSKKIAEKSKVSSSLVKPDGVSISDTLIKGDGDSELLAKLKAGSMIVSEQSDTSVPFGRKDEMDGEPIASGGDTKLEGIALSGVPEQIPVSFTANLHGTYNPDSVNDFDFSVRSLRLNAGGNFKGSLGFFGTYQFYSENVDTSANTSKTPTNMTGKNDIGELFVIWRHLLDTPINIKVGRLQPKLGLWKSNNKLSITNSYATYAYTVGSSLFKSEQPQDALEANMVIVNRLFFAVGVVNRKNQNTKEWYGHTSYKFGGADYLANEPEIDLEKEESIFDFLTLTIGGYGYVGTNGDPNTAVGTPRQNHYYRAGTDMDLLYKLFRLKLSAVLGNDDNPDLSYSQPSVKTYVGAIEGEYTLLKSLICSLRFEYQDDGANLVRRVIPTFAYNPTENFKIAAEYKYEYGKTAGDIDINENIGTLGVTFSF